MGDPRRIRRKFIRPGHPWQKERIEYEKQILRDYGLVNKSEVWKVNTKLKGFAGQAKRLIASRGDQADLEQKQLLARLVSLGLLNEGAQLDDVLSLKLENLLDRRLQTILVKKKLANTPKQARQFITHQHVKVGDQVVTSPSHFVKVSDEASIGFVARSPLSNDEHPERVAARDAKEKPAPEPLSEEEKRRKGFKKGGPGGKRPPRRETSRSDKPVPGKGAPKGKGAKPAEAKK